MGNQKNLKYNTIAIFQYEFPIQIHTINLILNLAEKGIDIHFFFVDSGGGINFVDLYLLFENKNIKIHNCTEKISFVLRVVNKFKRILKIPNIKIRLSIVKKTKKILHNIENLVLIGVEKKGLLWAESVFHKHKDKLVYYSLELYVEDHPAFKDDFEFSALRKKENKAHSLCAITIIQDTMRRDVLYQYNNIKNQNSILLPVSIKGHKELKQSNFAYKYFGIKKEKKILLYFGSLSVTRFGLDFVEAIKTLDKDYVVILHGFGDEYYIEELRKRADKNFIISTKLLEEDRLLELVKSSYIGFSLYKNVCNNDNLIAFSSAKIAEYCQCGVPFVGLNIGNYKILQDEFKCCELFQSYRELPESINTINHDYENYRKCAYKAFDKYYDFNTISKNIDKQLLC